MSRHQYCVNRYLKRSNSIVYFIKTLSVQLHIILKTEWYCDILIFLLYKKY